MKEKVLITGASGRIAQKVGHLLSENGYEVVYLTTNKQFLSNTRFYWDLEKEYINPDALYDVQHIIHLAGLSIAKRWSKKNKKIMFDSRIKTSRLIFETCCKLNIKPKTFLSTSAIGYYGFNNTGVKKETDVSGTDWLAKLCVAWEKEADNFKLINTRVIKLRLGVVLDKKNEIIKKTFLSYQLGFGVVFGDGRQPFPWIHIEDVIQCIFHIIKNKKIQGIFNLSSPENTSNFEFVNMFKTLKYKRSILIYIPKKILYWIFGEKTKLFLNKVSLSTNKIQTTGFEWKYPTLKMTLKELLN